MMRIGFLVIIVPLAIAASTTGFYADGRRINVTDGVNTQVFKVRGWSYSNSRIGEGKTSDETAAGFDALMRPDLCKTDFNLIRGQNGNSVKIYAYNVLNTTTKNLHLACLDAAWNNGKKPVFVTLSVWINALPFASDETRQAMLKEYATMVANTASHPAVFGYSIGSEMGGDPNNNKAYWDDFNLIAKAIRSNLKGARKLITTGTYQTNNVDPPVPVLAHVINGEKYNADVDVWGVDVYSPNPNEPNLRKDIFEYTKRPFVFPEYGATFQPANGNETVIATRIVEMVREMEQFSYSMTNNGNEGPNYDDKGPVYSGGMIFEFIDEYWKAPLDGTICQPNPASAQGYFGTWKVELMPGCPCVPPSQRTAKCEEDQRVPRALLAPDMLPSLWNAYEPQMFA